MWYERPTDVLFIFMKISRLLSACKYLVPWLLWAALTTQPAVADTPQAREMTILGWVEYVEFPAQQFKVKAKLDTGAKTSSLHAENIEWFTKKDEEWVRFEFQAPNYADPDHRGDTKTVTFEAPVERSVLIKQHKRASAKRAVVNMSFLLAGKKHQAQFTLTDRSKFNYPVLLGRRFLKQVALVDPGNTFLKTSSKTK